MIAIVIILIVLAAVYITGDAQRKQKMGNIGSEIVDVAKTTAQDTVVLTKSLIDRIKARHDEKKNNSRG